MPSALTGWVERERRKEGEKQKSIITIIIIIIEIRLIIIVIAIIAGEGVKAGHPQDHAIIPAPSVAMVHNSD